MKKTVLLIALLASFAIVPTAYACSPAPSWPPSATDNLAQRDIAFVGTVTSIAQDKSIYGAYHITFAVNKTYKGSLEDTVTIQTNSSSAACGYDNGYTSFAKGSVWAIYGNGTADAGYTTSSLSLNTSYASVADAVTALAALGLTPKTDEPIACTMQYAPVCGKDTAGVVRTFGNSCTLGAEKATFLYAGECSVTHAPATDLSLGSRGAAVTWLQNFLIGRHVGTAGAALTTTGATGYFGTLTRAALAEFQNMHAITPTAGYFGAKTRAFISKLAVEEKGETFTGTISAVDTACFADGVCSVVVGGKKVILLTGMRMGTIPPVGSLVGVESIGDLEAKIGAQAEVYATPAIDSGADYTLYGSGSYYVKVLK